MRSALILVTIMAALFPASSALADDYEDCRNKCFGDRDSCVMNCPSAYDSSEQKWGQCVQKCNDAYTACVKSCPVPSSAAPGTRSATYHPRKAAPQKERGQERAAVPGASRPPVAVATLPATNPQ
ncbi:MAG TPA: hypothetical protein VIU46_05570 [Gallionellaceae bacterium]